MNITQLNFVYIGSCLGYITEKPTGFFGKLLHSNLDLDWHIKVYNHDKDYYLLEEAFLNHEEYKWEKTHYLARKSTFSWNIYKEGNMAHIVEVREEVKPLILK